MSTCGAGRRNFQMTFPKQPRIWTSPENNRLLGKIPFQKKSCNGHDFVPPSTVWNTWPSQRPSQNDHSDGLRIADFGFHMGPQRFMEPAIPLLLLWNVCLQLQPIMTYFTIMSTLNLKPTTVIKPWSIVPRCTTYLITLWLHSSICIATIHYHPLYCGDPHCLVAIRKPTCWLMLNFSHSWNILKYTFIIS